MTHPNPHLVDRHLQALAADDASVRGAAINVLTRAGASAQDIVAALLAVMRRGEYYTSMQAAQALARFGQLGLPALIEALAFTSYGVAGHAAEAIGEVNDPAAVPELISLVACGVETAIEALGRIGHAAAPAVPLLIQLVERRTEHDDSAEYVYSGSPRSMAWEAGEALGRIGDGRALDCLLHMLHDENGRSRWTAAEALGRIGDAAAAEALKGRLSDADETVREKVREALRSVAK